MIQAREPGCDLIDLVVEPVVGDRSVDIPVQLRARPVEIVGDEEDLQGPPATDQPGEPGRRTAARDQTRSGLELAEKRVLA